ncbi:MAG: hypothetical protein ACJAQ3_002195 [Planctomycetota bacterium]|jgi:hypothetical protein
MRLLLLTLCLTACAPRSEGVPGVPGAPSAIATNDARLQKAVAHVLKEENLAATSVTISDATTQVVAGTNYTFVISVASGPSYEAAVYEDLSGALSTTRFKSR